jgi:hypothetical protein
VITPARWLSVKSAEIISILIKAVKNIFLNMYLSNGKKFSFKTVSGTIENCDLISETPK